MMLQVLYPSDNLMCPFCCYCGRLSYLVITVSWLYILEHSKVLVRKGVKSVAEKMLKMKNLKILIYLHTAEKIKRWK